jgi:hypothetical protein
MQYKPLLLILHLVNLRGGVKYGTARQSTTTDADAEAAELVMTRTIQNRPEYNAARALRAKIENHLRIETGAAVTEIGLFAADCEETREAIDAAGEQIGKWIDDFGEIAECCELSSRILCFPVMANHIAVFEAISGLLVDAFDVLRLAIFAQDVKNIKAALESLKGFDRLLSDEHGAQLREIVTAARTAARQINRAGRGKPVDDLDTQRAAVEAAILALRGTITGIDSQTPKPEPETPETVTVTAPDDVVDDYEDDDYYNLCAPEAEMEAIPI